jgi:hypothetical protein
VAFEGLEPDEGKLSSPVLRGEKGRNALTYPVGNNIDYRITELYWLIVMEFTLKNRIGTLQHEIYYFFCVYLLWNFIVNNIL